MSDDNAAHRDVFTAVRPLLTHLIYAAAGAWVAATVLTGRLPAPTATTVPAPPNSGVVRVVVVVDAPGRDHDICPDRPLPPVTPGLVIGRVPAMTSPIPQATPQSRNARGAGATAQVRK
ncbi:hypothetical protein [Candidatus Mycobacterium methanotrophicum]|uniref:Uncharacterized protein n=1 Tax=Candidatus Mycobacterium methanotrophicum TaxID=2943498 RepID=A0ABY4QRI5_9MYCO|nr:hypothetical protein [Candidatus Mycobacterium methanotrophicum]UQX13558.1 hypothetical protein M5I08_25540 [Candidatus Mycobacterium methanotrophicum]